MEVLTKYLHFKGICNLYDSDGCCEGHLIAMSHTDAGHRHYSFFHWTSGQKISSTLSIRTSMNKPELKDDMGFKYIHSFKDEFGKVHYVGPFKKTISLEL